MLSFTQDNKFDTFFGAKVKNFLRLSHLKSKSKFDEAKYIKSASTDAEVTMKSWFDPYHSDVTLTPHGGRWR